jgi:hypothetical protein
VKRGNVKHVYRGLEFSASWPLNSHDWFKFERLAVDIPADGGSAGASPFLRLASQKELTPMTLRMDSQCWLAAVILACVLSTGCSIFQPKVSPELTAKVTPNGVEDGKVDPPPGNFTVEVRPNKGEPIAKEQPLAEPLTVQTALENTKANKKFRKFTLELHRPLPDGRVHSMVLQYDRTAKHVDPEFDYAVLPGDRILVIEDTSTMLDEFMDNVTMPFGGPTRLSGKSKDGKFYRVED